MEGIIDENNQTRNILCYKTTELIGKIGTSIEATIQAMKTAMTTGSKGKLATAGTETATNMTKTVVKTADTGKEAALQTMRTTIEAASNEQAATKTIETATKFATAGTEVAVKAEKAVVHTVTTGKEAALQAAIKTIETANKAVIADINTATIGAEDAIQAMKSPMTMSSREKAVTKTTGYVGENAKTRNSLVTGHNTKSSLTLPEVPASNAMQSSNVNETMHALQKQINELIPRIIEEKEYENDVIVIVKTVINPDTKEKTKVVVLKTVTEEDEKTFTVGGVRANKGSEICVKDVNIIGRTSVNEGFDTQPDDHPIIRFLRRLFRYIDVKAFMTFIKTMRKSKRVQDGGKMLSKHILDQFIQGLFMILNLADGLYQIHKGEIGAGVVYMLYFGLCVMFEIDITPTEGDTTQFSSVSDMNGDPFADLKGDIEYEITLTATWGIVIKIKSKTPNKNASKAR